MLEQKVWCIVKKEDVPNNKCLVGCRWIFEICKDGQYQARIVTQGYTQVPGIDFNFHHAPIVQDVTFHILLILSYTNKNWIALQIDIRTSF